MSVRSDELGTDTLVGEKLDKYRVRYSAVDYRCLSYASSDSFHTAVDLGNHSAADDAFLFKIRHLADIDCGDKGGIVVLIL